MESGIYYIRLTDGGQWSKIYRKFTSNYRLIAFLISVLSFTLLNVIATAQENTVTSGGNATGAGGLVSFTIGQVFHQTHDGNEGTVAEGVQQPYEIFVITSVEDAADIHLAMSAFPNPVSERLTLVVDESVDFSVAGYYFRLFDISGREIQIDRQTEIDMSGLIPAVYFIRIRDSQQELKVFKIVKK